MRVTNYQIICAMEIKILVKENEKAELDKFIETCKEHGMELTREGGGKLPNFSGYYAEFKGVRWQKDDTDKRQSNIPDVSISVCPKCHASEVYENRNGDGECAVCGHTWQTGC